MRDLHRKRVIGATLLAMALLLAACGDGAGDDAGSVEGPTITVASFNFPESVILAEIYAQALEADGYDVERNLNLGSRELIFPELQSGAIDLLPEYLGSAIAVGFGEDAPTDQSEALDVLTDLFEADDVRVLEPAPGQDKTCSS
jgi:osmoprotectant transport system substrate-binding protein